MQNIEREIAEIDKIHFKMVRENIFNFIKRAGKETDKEGLILLDIAPQDHEGAAPHFPEATIKTLDLNPKSGASYIADICGDNSKIIPANEFDVVICTEVLEHTLNPFAAVQEIKRILKPGGVAFVTTPFNFRIHGPRPDCWRFTEDGLRALFAQFDIQELNALEDADRFLMPIHYSLIARKKYHE